MDQGNFHKEDYDLKFTIACIWLIFQNVLNLSKNSSTHFRGGLIYKIWTYSEIWQNFEDLGYLTYRVKSFYPKI